MAKVLIVDDEAMIREVISEYAIYEGYEVCQAQNGMEAVELCKKSDFDVIVMDLMMPGIDGFTAYEQIRKIKSIPALILSARGEEYDKLYGFRIGIDDYMVKPFSPKELMARLRVIISRNRNRINEPEKEEDVLCFGGLIIDKKQYAVYEDGVKLPDMTLREFDLLWYLASHPKIVFSREKLLNSVWGYDYAGDGRTVDTHVKMLRHALGSYRDYIVTSRGVGYKFDADHK